MLKSKFNNKFDNYDDNNANPMDGVSNMSDAMLVLAVGIMLALVINWKVDLQVVGQNFNTVSIDEKNMEEIEIESQNPISNMTVDDLESNFKKSGSVYTDVNTGKTYIVVED